MNVHSSPIIQASELLRLQNAENLFIADVSNGKNAKSNYDTKHLEGAIFIDLNTQLSEIKPDVSNGGRHPLPNIRNFTQTLWNIGISEKSHVVIYDDKNGSNAAAGFWWMLKAIGHEKVQVLNGGLQEAEKFGFPMSSKNGLTSQARLYETGSWKLPIADMEEVEKALENESHIILDVRDRERYSGETEPIDLIAGHIPGAINFPFSENLDENGLFLSPATLRNNYENIFGNVPVENIIVHCGSGVTACHSLLAIAYAGLELPKLYVGSWSEWSRNYKEEVMKMDLKEIPGR